VSVLSEADNTRLIKDRAALLKQNGGRGPSNLTGIVRFPHNPLDADAPPLCNLLKLAKGHRAFDWDASRMDSRRPAADGGGTAFRRGTT
jgi:hypothetical protein